MLSKNELQFETLRKFAMLKGYEVTTERIEGYVEYLKEYNHDEVMAAFKNLFESSHRFPDLSDIIKIIKPPLTETDKANEVMGAIMEALQSFGPMQPKEARAKLGPIAWFVVERVGGWNSLCMATYDQLNSMRAQVRDMAKAAEKLQHVSPDDCLLEHRQGGLKRLSELFDNEKPKEITNGK